MSSTKEHKNIIAQIKTIASLVEQVSGSIGEMSTSLQTVMSSSQGDHTELVVSAKTLAQNISSSTSSLSDCLSDLLVMGEAMVPIAESSPDAAGPLLVNLYSTFLRQFGIYYHEMDGAISRNAETLKSASKASARSSGPPTASQSVTEPPPVVSVAAQEPEPKKKKKKSHAEKIPEVEKDAPAAVEKSVPEITEREESSAGQGMFSLEAAAAAGASASPGHKKKTRKLAEGKQQSKTSDNRLEPNYLFVSSSVEDALGPVMNSRPQVFSSVSSILSKAPLSTYYVSLLRRSSLAYFILKNYVNLDEETQADLLCDILETDCVEMEPFVSTLGEVVMPDDVDLTRMPACAWRVCSSDDQTHIAYTSYVLVDRPDASPAAIIQDVITTPSGKDEVLHLVELLPDLDDVAKVSVYSRRSTGGENKSGAIMSFTKSCFSSTGFTLVQESEVNQRRSELQQKSRDNLVGLSGSSLDQPSGKATFQTTVQMASLEKPAPKTGPNLTLGGMAMGAVRGGYEMLKAPLTVGRAVGGAVMDVTGATDAMRSNQESTFKAKFPELAGFEELVEYYNAGWSEGAIPNPGILFIGKQYVCFSSSVGSSKFSIEYDEIKDIKKAKSAKVLDNSIEIYTHLNELFLLTNFLQRDEVYNVLMQQWLKR
ncbi:GRAM domain containing protein, putative [Angomonas deanei]|uniref:GRAM domain containing protein, putative n=1 Tax=Angomonas deanei TaxID=59799 RepID=A0A7G2CG47_9TRYP|nr:GRAM domain containing protein, putative [Angomonas deanei]